MTLVTLLLFLACWMAFCSVAAAILAKSERDADWRHTILLGSLIGGVAIIAVTESLSLVTRLQRGPLLGAWITILVAAGALSAYLRARSSDTERVDMRRLLRVGVPADLSAAEKAMLCLIVLQVALLGVVAVLYPPNNYDSMVYHLPRIMQWEQLGSVAFYPVAVMMQVRGAPFAEYAIAQPMILSGTDWFANLVQWYAMVLSAIAASLVVAEFGGDRLRQIASAVLSVSIPMGILQATSTQNDYVVAAWTICFVLLGMRFLRSASSWLWAVSMGVALGLAILTKQTALAYVPAFCLVIGVAAVLKFGWRSVMMGITVILAVVILNAGFGLRNVQLYGSPVGPHGGLANDYRSGAVTVSNAIRNAAIHLPVPDLPVLGTLGEGLLWNLDRLHSLTGIDPGDPRTSLTPNQNAFAVPFMPHEDLAGNFAHLCLIIAAVAMCIASIVRWLWARGARSKAPRLDVVAYAGCLLFGFVFFGYYFKWQIWNSRLQFTVFVLASPLIATVLFASSRRLIAATAILVGLAGFAWTFANQTRPLNFSVPFGRQERMERYFANRVDLWPTFQAITASISRASCRRIGLRISTDPFEYPLWVLLRDAGLRPEIKHLQSMHMAELPPDPTFQPCAVLSAGPDDRYSAVMPLQFGGFYLYHLPDAGLRNEPLSR